MLTTKYSLELPQHYENQKSCIESLLSCGVIPIVNENDTISVTELMFTDNDELSGYIQKAGPMALPELTTYKYIIEGDGQIRCP